MSTFISKLIPTSPKKRATSPPPNLSPAPASTPPSPERPESSSSPAPAAAAAKSDDPCPVTAPPITLEEVLFSGLVSRVHKENRALKAKNEALVEKALEARREKDKAVAALESSKKSMQDQIDALEAKNAKLKMRLKNADALLSKTELWFDAYVKLSKEATISHGIPSPGSSEAAPSLPSSKSGRSSSNGHASDTGHGANGYGHGGNGRYPRAEKLASSPPVANGYSGVANGYSSILEKQPKTWRVTSDPVPASSSAPRVHYSPYGASQSQSPPTTSASRSAPGSAQVSRQSSQHQLGKRTSAQQLAHRASQSHLVQRTQSILQRRPVDPAPSIKSEDIGEYWAAVFDERIHGLARDDASIRVQPTPQPSSYYPPTQRSRQPAAATEYRTLVHQTARPLRQAERAK